jgi:hypothetical protein
MYHDMFVHQSGLRREQGTENEWCFDETRLVFAPAVFARAEGWSSSSR